MESLYSKIGPKNLKSIIDDFYTLIFNESSISHLFKNEKSEIRDKQYMFLTQFLGGPQLYTQQFGHPKMRMRHLPHAIDENAMNEWLRCMKTAINNSDLSEDLKVAFYEYFPKIALHMVNR